MKFSIIIVTWDRFEFTKNCIDTVLFTTEATDREIIIVDNGSVDGTQDYLKQLKKEGKIDKLILFNKNKGFGIAINKAMSMARGEYIVSVDNDIIMLVGWWEFVLEKMKNKKIGQIGLLECPYNMQVLVDDINIAPPNVAGVWAMRKKLYDGGVRWCEKTWKEVPWQAVIFSKVIKDKGYLVGNVMEKFAVDLSVGNHNKFKEYYEKTFGDRNIECLLDRFLIEEK